MRVEPGAKKSVEPPKTSFQQVLKKAQVRPQPKPQPKAPPVAKAQPSKAAAKVQGQLVARRAESELQRPELRRVAEKIAALLLREPRVERPRPEPKHVEAPPLPLPMPLAEPAPKIDAAPVAPVSQPEPLADRIERMLVHAELLARAEGPALQLSLHQGRASQVEVVRTGKNEVSLFLQSRDGADRRALAAQVGPIRAALAERGLRVRQISVG